MYEVNHFGCRQAGLDGGIYSLSRECPKPTGKKLEFNVPRGTLSHLLRKRVFLKGY
jgi:hypothetical protein